jgi:hypothetical protein
MHSIYKLLVVFLATTSQIVCAQTYDDLWQDTPEPMIQARRKSAVSARTLEPVMARTLTLNGSALKKAMARVPKEFESKGVPEAEFFLPLPDGKFARFMIEESSMMEPKLAKKYPDLKTYVARGIDDPSLTARLDQTPQGFHAIIFTPSGTVYIDPYWRDDTTSYLCYLREHRPLDKSLNCLVQAGDRAAGRRFQRRQAAERPTGAALRTYRLAVSCTGEYATAAGGGTVNGALGAILTTVNRVSAVFERDLSIRLKLVNGEDQLIFLNPATDGFTNDDGDFLIDENQTKVDAIIGNANYDIGHVFSTGGGGLAGLGVVGLTGQKAQGVTGSSNPVGDPFDIDYVAHEMGHQFGADHTFNSTAGSCGGGNRNASTAYEPGSGTSIMAYAGICSPQNLAPNSDDYFHSVSYDQIDDYTSTAPGNVGVATATGNSPPVIAALASYTIPQQTPFALTASATDTDAGDVLTYGWEQFDLGPAQDPTAAPRDNGSSPLFRSFDPSLSPTRLFPSLSYILNNANVPPTTVGSFISGEFLPTTSRTMTFRVTVRDSHPAGGGSNYASTTVTSTTAAGPFALTSQGTAATIAAGTLQTVNWSVAGTIAAPVNCADVKISLSTDGGNTFPVVLAESTANDGTEEVTIPDLGHVATTQGRIKIEAVGNIFFDISDANLTITTTNTAPVLSMAGSVTVQRGTPTPTVATVGTVTDLDTPLTATITSAPADTVITASISGANIVVSARAESSISTTLSSRTYPVTLKVTDSAGSMSSASFNLIVQPNPAPTLGDYVDQNLLKGMSVTATPSSAPADANGNLGASPATVFPATLPGGGTLSIDQVTGVVTASALPATVAGVYTIRVTLQDTSGAAVVKGFNLTVADSSPVIVAGTASAPTAENCLPANAAVDPAETVTINLGLMNQGGVASTDLVATLLNTGGVTPITTSQNYGQINPVGNQTRPFTFRASGTCGGTITATLQLQDGLLDLGTVNYVLRLGVSQNAGGTLQNFDSVIAPALPYGWTATVASGTPSAWATTTSTADTAPNCAFATPTTSVSDNRLDSAPFPVVSATAQVTFRHLWKTETDYDGGVLEISIGGGAFTDLITVGGSFSAGGYTGTIDLDYSNPLAGRAAWTGTVSAYTTTTANLPASAAGQNVRLRFRLGCDTSVSPSGSVWRVDSISLADVSYACCGEAPVITSLMPASAAFQTSYSHTFTSSSTPPPTFSLTAGTLPPGLGLAGAVLSGTPTVPGVYPGITVTAANGLNPNATQTFSFTVADTYERYVAAFGFSVANADLAADPDRDGIENILEYALNLSPQLSSLAGLPVIEKKAFGVDDYLSIRFTRLTTATDLTYAVQSSSDLSSWTNVASSVGGAVTTGGGFIGETGAPPALTVEVRDTTAFHAVAAPRRYMRLLVFKTAQP